MEDLESRPQPAQLPFSPLMISMIGIVSTTMAIAIYQFIVTKCCMRRQAMVDTPSQPTPGYQGATGVDEKVLESIPILSYSSKQGGVFPVDQGECAICLGELEEGDVVRLLPSCRHAFHIQCIDEWFMSHSSCPICRSPIVASMSPVLPMPIEVDEEDAVDLLPQFHDQGATDFTDVPDLASQKGWNGLLCHCDSLILTSERNVPRLPKTFHRSLSMDNSYISIKIQGDHDRDSSSSSSSKSVTLKRSSSYKARTFKPLGRASSMLMKSFSQLRNGHGQEANGILPY